MRSLRAWFDGRSLRERRLILAMLGLAAVTLVWGGVLRPLDDALASARSRHEDAVVRLGEAESEADAVRDMTRMVARPLAGSLADTVRARADQVGFTVDSLEAAGQDQVRVTIPSARAGALAAWIAQGEAAGVLVDEATLTDKGDRTVSATLLLRARRP